MAAILCPLVIDMSKFNLPHHQAIAAALDCFNPDYLLHHNILFGGGTRIALELDEYRESIDIDFLCADRAAYKAVREQVTHKSLGQLVKQEFSYVRDIRADRDAVRTIIDYQKTKIKLEFVSFDNYALTQIYEPDFLPVPCIDRVTCFYTKLLANADRALNIPYKDIFDLLAMYTTWGNIPKQSIELAEERYGAVVKRQLVLALKDMTVNKARYFKAASDMNMKESWAENLINTQAKALLAQLSQ
jgi:hypothetical protein